MDITKTIAELKTDPEFANNVGMILIHNGVVRGWSRAAEGDVSEVDIAVDRDRIEELRREYEARPGIYRVVVEAIDGVRKIGDDVLFIVVAGDIRENVKPALAELLDRIKSEAVTKKERFTT
jgi:molybdopterin synthase catalytic subunit